MRFYIDKIAIQKSIANHYHALFVCIIAISFLFECYLYLNPFHSFHATTFPRSIWCTGWHGTYSTSFPRNIRDCSVL